VRLFLFFSFLSPYAPPPFRCLLQHWVELGLTEAQRTDKSNKQIAANEKKAAKVRELDEQFANLLLLQQTSDAAALLKDDESRTAPDRPRRTTTLLLGAGGGGAADENSESDDEAVKCGTVSTVSNLKEQDEILVLLETIKERDEYIMVLLGKIQRRDANIVALKAVIPDEQMPLLGGSPEAFLDEDDGGYLTPSDGEDEDE